MLNVMDNPIISFEEIRRILSSRPKALVLYERVCEYFGTALRFYRQDEGEKISHTGFNTIGYDGRTIDVTICLDPAALMHECLHVKMMMDGFPVILKVGRTPEAKAVLYNLICHVIFFDEFLSFGFDQAEFVYDSNGLEDVNNVWSELESIQWDPDEERLRRAHWNAQLITHLIARRSGFSNQFIEVLKIGRINLPTMEQDAEWIRNWLDRGDFKNPQKFSAAANELFNAIGYDSAGFARVVPFDDCVRLMRTA